MPFSTEQVKSLAAAVNLKLGDRGCPLCGNKDWSISPDLVIIPLKSGPGPLIARTSAHWSGYGIPAIGITCTNCGHPPSAYRETRIHRLRVNLDACNIHSDFGRAGHDAHEGKVALVARLCLGSSFGFFDWRECLGGSQPMGKYSGSRQNYDWHDRDFRYGFRLLF